MKTLVVEDHPDTRAILVEMLSTRGHTVIESADGSNALLEAKRDVFDFVLLDLSLPDLDGLDVCRSLRALSGWNDSMILACTGRNPHESLQAVLNAGADDYLVKPFASDELAIRITIAENGMRQRASRRENEVKLHALAGRLVVAEEQERRRLASELHDSVGQNLGWLKIRLSELRTKAVTAECAPIMQEMSGTLDKIIQETRSLTFEISPPILYEMGLEAALEWLTEHFQSRFGLECLFEFSGSVTPLSTQIAVLMFQSVRELLFNVVKHAKAKSANVAVQRKDGRISIIVTDNGIGMDLASSTRRIEKFSGFGIFSIRERLAYIGGSLEVESVRGRGTTITVRAPIKTTDDENAGSAK